MGNCQSANVVYQARKQGYDVSALPLDESNPVMMDLGFNPQNAYIDPSTGAPPEVKCSYSHSSEECIDWLKANIKVGETYEMSYPVQNEPMGSGHVVEVTKTKNGDLKFYDPQNGKMYNESLVENDVMFMAGVDDYAPVQFFPRIFRVDNAKINVDILNKISRPRKK